MTVFLLYCVASGLLLGATVGSVLLLIVTSIQLVAAPAYLWAADVIDADALLAWMLFGLFTHQLAFLIGGHLRLWLERSPRRPPQKPPETAVDPDQAAADLSAAAARMRRALIGQTRLTRAGGEGKHPIRGRR